MPFLNGDVEIDIPKSVLDNYHPQPRAFLKLPTTTAPATGGN